MTPASVLVLEDDSNAVSILRAVLNTAGLRVFEAMDGAEASAVCQKYGHEIDLLIVDVVLGDESGPAIVRQIRAVRPFMPVLYISGHDPEDLVRRGLFNRGELASTPFLQKPFSASDLKERVDSMLKARPACTACLELQKAALDATHRYIEVLERLDIAGLRQEHELVPALEAALREAARTRDKATEAYTHHLASHGSATSAA
ncbi:MAG TPA: response regulator [Bryobacteraceae bacterium]|nr:response regulator [Bryobacteraceae bacterium]